MSCAVSNPSVEHSSLYQEFQAERHEIMLHKYYESQKAGYDIGFDRALTDWILKHRAAWRRARQEMLTRRGADSRAE